MLLLTTWYMYVCTVIALFFFSRWDPDSAVQLCAQVRYTCTTYYLLRTTRYDSCVRTTYTYFIYTVYIIHYTSVYMTYKIYTNIAGGLCITKKIVI